MACRPDEQKRLTVAPATRDRQAGPDGRDAGDVVPCEPCGIAAAEDDVLDLGRIELRHLPQHVA